MLLAITPSSEFSGISVAGHRLEKRREEEEQEVMQERVDMMGLQ